MSEAKLILAIPSKGRLMEAAENYFSEAGLKVERLGGQRRYQGSLKGLEGVEVRFLSASEIASGLIAGDIDLGITGRDLLHEKVQFPDEVVAPLSALDFGFADVVVGVPEAWLDVETMADLAEVAAEIRQQGKGLMRVATKFSNMTRAFFAEHGIADYRIVESLGATEGAPAAGTAELIVDITSTGSTLVANNLKILPDGIILKSEAFLCASLGVKWDKPKLTIIEDVLNRLAARDRAKRYVEVRLEVGGISAVAVASVLKAFGGDFAFGTPEPGEQELTLHVPKKALHETVSALRAKGCDVATVRSVDYIFSATNPLYQALLTELENAKG